MKMAMESMEMAPGAIPRPGRVPEQRLLSPEIGLRWWRRGGTFRGRRLDDLGYSRYGEYMGERARSVAAQGAHTTPRRGPRAGRVQVWCGHPVAPLRLLFGLRLRYVILGTLAFVRSRSENISYVTFLKPDRKSVV